MWLREGIGACPRLCFAKGIPEAILLTSEPMVAGELGVLAFISTPLLPQTAQTLSCPRHLFSPRCAQMSSSGYLQSNQGCDCSQAGVTVQ